MLLAYTVNSQIKTKYQHQNWCRHDMRPTTASDKLLGVSGIDSKLVYHL